MTYGPGGVLELVDTVSVDDPDVVIEVGLNEAETPVGSGVPVDQVTVPEKFRTGVTVEV